MNKVDDISIIIRAKNEEQWIGHSIQAVLDKFYKPEIIICDNHSTDRTLDIVKNFQHDTSLEESRNYSNIKILKIDDYTPGKSINLGVQNATKKYLLIISAHCVLSKINFEKHKKDLEKFACIFGNQIPIRDGKRITKRYVWTHFLNEEAVNMFSDYEDRYFLHNALALYRTDFLKGKPFNEVLVGKEDRYWASEVINEGNKTLYDPCLEAHHHYTPNGATWVGRG